MQAHRDFAQRMTDMIAVMRQVHGGADSDALHALSPVFGRNPEQLRNYATGARWHVGDTPLALLVTMKKLEDDYRLPLRYLKAFRSACERAA